MKPIILVGGKDTLLNKPGRIGLPNVLNKLAELKEESKAIVLLDSTVSQYIYRAIDSDPDLKFTSDQIFDGVLEKDPLTYGFESGYNERISEQYQQPVATMIRLDANIEEVRKMTMDGGIGLFAGCKEELLIASIDEAVAKASQACTP